MDETQARLDDVTAQAAAVVGAIKDLAQHASPDEVEAARLRAAAVSDLFGFVLGREIKHVWEQSPSEVARRIASFGASHQGVVDAYYEFKRGSGAHLSMEEQAYLREHPEFKDEILQELSRYLAH